MLRPPKPEAEPEAVANTAKAAKELTAQERIERINAWKRLYDWYRTSDYRFGRIANADRSRLGKRPNDALLFVDDDMIVDPGWLAAHLRSLEHFGCDVVNGRIFGIRERFPHGAKLEKCGAGNVSFRRHLVAPAGLGLRFDPAFNKTGTEDQAFFRAATAKGADIRQSDWPQIFNYYGRAEMPEDEVINKMLVTASMHQNEVARVRAEKGAARAVLSASRGLVYGLKSAGLTLLGSAQRLLGGGERSRRTALSARKELLKMRGRFAGISGRMVSRQEVRRSDPGA